MEVTEETPAPVRLDDCLSIYIDLPFASTESATVATAIQGMLTAGGKIAGATGAYTILSLLP